MLAEVATTHVEGLNLDIPVRAPGVDDHLLDPRNTWPNPAAYDQARDALAAKFIANFERFEVAQAIVDAGPRRPSAGR